MELFLFIVVYINFIYSCSQKVYTFSCLGARCVNSGSRYGLKQGQLFSLSLCLYWFYISLFMKCIKSSCLGARCISSWISYGLEKGIPCHFFFLLFIYKLTQWGSVENIVLYHKNIMKILTIWHMVGGIYCSGSRVCGFVVCVVVLWGYRQALNRLKINSFFEEKYNCGFRNGLLEIAEARNPSDSYVFQHQHMHDSWGWYLDYEHINKHSHSGNRYLKLWLYFIFR